jgi:hypothetical protein
LFPIFVRLRASGGEHRGRRRSPGKGEHASVHGRTHFEQDRFSANHRHSSTALDDSNNRHRTTTRAAIGQWGRTAGWRRKTNPACGHPNSEILPVSRIYGQWCCTFLRTTDTSADEYRRHRRFQGRAAADGGRHTADSVGSGRACACERRMDGRSSLMVGRERTPPRRPSGRTGRRAAPTCDQPGPRGADRRCAVAPQEQSPAGSGRGRSNYMSACSCSSRQARKHTHTG